MNKYDDTDYLIEREESIEYEEGSDINVGSIEKDIKRCEELIKPEHANWIGISNQLAIAHVVDRVKEVENDLTTVYMKGYADAEENYKNLIADVSRIAKELGLEEDGTIDEIYAKIKEKDKEIEKKDKIIYKMIDSFIDLGFGFEYCSNDDRCINDCDKCIKQYFERKVKE